MRPFTHVSVQALVVLGPAGAQRLGERLEYRQRQRCAGPPPLTQGDPGFRNGADLIGRGGEI